MISRMSYALWILALLLLIRQTYGADKNTPADEITPDVAQQLALPIGAKLELLPVATSNDEKYTEEEAKRNAPDILSLEACHVGGNRFLFKTTFARKPVFENAVFIIYLDMDANKTTGRQDEDTHRGVDVMVTVHDTQTGLSFHNPAFTQKNTYLAGAARVGNALYITLDAPLKDMDGKFPLDIQLLSQRIGGRGDSTPRRVVQLPRSDQQVPRVERRGAPDLRPLSDYRYHDRFVKLEKLEDKGLTYEKVAPKTPIAFGRPRPPVPFASVARKPTKPGSMKLQRVPVQLLEEAGVARRQAAISFGFPLPQGALFDLNNLRVLSPGGEEVLAQFTATSFWPDDSLKWVLIDFTAPLAASQERNYTVEFGSQVKRTAAPPTPPDLHALLPPPGVRLVDEHGKLFTASDENARITNEETGPLKLVIRTESPYVNQNETYMRSIRRTTYRAGSQRVTITYTHINDYLKTEFTDITSLTLPIAPPGGIKKATIFLRDDSGALVPHEGLPISLVQFDEKNCTLLVGGREIKSTKAPGLIRCETAHGVLTAVVHDFWQLWPKGLSADEKELRIELLPKQPNAEYGKDLPHYLMYPFVSGFYRFKWGMAFTTRITLDFDPQTPPEELLAEANMPVLPVVPAAWYAETKALGPMAAPVGKQFAQWDALVAKCYESYIRTRERDRTYGYFNYGDWYGERGRNWGNNEYDFAHGFFMQFARTGNRNYFRLALAHARHQADVDCVHAYPDPAIVGGNNPHSIGHTGAWTERTLHGVWSTPYGSMTSAANGHTWASGMMDAWFLTGDARIMEAALGLGEHIAWSMSRTFNALGTHERSAGWALCAIMSIYRGTYDPVYLEAAKRIVAVPLREQKFEEGGAWPHLLPQDHAGGHPNARGNNLFLIGILLAGLETYHRETRDPAVEKSLIAGAEWVLKSWDENAEGWPYSATPTGEPLYKPTTSLNMLIIEPLAYVGHLTGQERFITVAETAFKAAVRSGPSDNGKSIAQRMHFAAGVMALLQDWYKVHRADKGVGVLDCSGASMVQYLAKTTDAEEHSVRAPDEKIFYLKLRGEAAELIATRRPHGAIPRRTDFAFIRVQDSTGKTIYEDKCDTDDKHEFRCALKGTPGSVFKIVINDDQRGVWSLKGDGLGIVMQTVKDFRIGGVGRGRYHFYVPPGTTDFKVRLLGVHPGIYAGLVLTPENKIAGFHQDANQGQALVPGAPKVQVPRPNEHPELGLITVKPDPKDTGKMWSLVLTAAQDIGCELDGVPPYLSLTKDAWFDPQASTQ